MVEYSRKATKARTARIVTMRDCEVMGSKGWGDVQYLSFMVGAKGHCRFLHSDQGMNSGAPTDSRRSSRSQGHLRHPAALRSTFCPPSRRLRALQWPVPP